MKHKKKKNDNGIGKFLIGTVLILIILVVAITLVDNYLSLGICIIPFIDAMISVLGKIRELVGSYLICLLIVVATVCVGYTIVRPSTKIRKFLLKMLLKSSKLEIASDFFSIIWEKEELRGLTNELLSEENRHLSHETIIKCIGVIDKAYEKSEKDDERLIEYFSAVGISCLSMISEDEEYCNVEVFYEKTMCENKKEYEIAYRDKIIYVYISKDVKDYIIKDVILSLNDLLVILIKRDRKR